MQVRRFEVYLMRLNPTVGSEIQKTRPCIIVSPDELHALRTVIIAPLTSKGFDYVFRPKLTFQDKQGLVLLDQICTVDKSRLIKKVGTVDKAKARELADTLVEMFAYAP